MIQHKILKTLARIAMRAKGVAVCGTQSIPRLKTHMFASAFVAGALVSAVAQAETFPEITASNALHPYKIVFSEDWWEYFVLVPEMQEIWLVTDQGVLIERGAVLHREGDFHIGWEYGDRFTFYGGFDMEVIFTATTSLLASQITTIVSGELETRIANLPPRTRFDHNYLLKDHMDTIIGRWELTGAEIVVTLTDRPPQTVPVRALVASITPIKDIP